MYIYIYILIIIINNNSKNTAEKILLRGPNSKKREHKGS